MFDPIVLSIVALPLLAALAVGLNLVLGETILAWRQIQRVVVWALALAFAGSIWVFITVLGDPAPREVMAWNWFSVGGVSIDVAFLIDSLSSLMMLVVTGFSFLNGVKARNDKIRVPISNSSLCEIAQFT